MTYLETRMPLEHRKVDSQIVTTADYSTGTVTTATVGSRTIVLSGATLTQDMVNSHILLEGEQRDYLIDSISGSTITTRDPYEGTSIVAGTGTFLIRKRFIPLPFDFESFQFAMQTSTPRPVPLADLPRFEPIIAQNLGMTGEPEMILERGSSKAADYAVTGATFTKGSDVITLTSGAFVAGRDTLARLRVRGEPIDFELYEYTNTTNMKFRPAWAKESGTLKKIEINPAGTRLVEVYPHPGVARSIRLYYWAMSPMLVHEYDSPRYLPERFHALWELETLKRIGAKYDVAMYGELMAHLADSDSIARSSPVQMGQYGDCRGPVNNSPEGYVRDDMWEGQWRS
jgi:hypothetical protein